VWANLDPNDDEQMVELSKFINANYVEASSASKDFRLAYSKEFIKWAWGFPTYLIGENTDKTIL